MEFLSLEALRQRPQPFAQLALAALRSLERTSDFVLFYDSISFFGLSFPLERSAEVNKTSAQ
jgi:hypothetical protein